MGAAEPAFGPSPDLAPVVVCGIDDPRVEHAVIAFAADLVDRIGGRLVLVHAQPLPLSAVAPQVTYAAPQPSPRESLRAAARVTAHMAAGSGVSLSAKLDVGFGDLDTRLLEIAERHAADFIVAGSHGALNSWCDSSLVQRLLERSRCPVIAVPLSAPTAGVAGVGRHASVG